MTSLKVTPLQPYIGFTEVDLVNVWFGQDDQQKSDWLISTEPTNLFSIEEGDQLHWVDRTISAAWIVPSEITQYWRDRISVSSRRDYFFDCKPQQWRIKVNSLIPDSWFLWVRCAWFKMSRECSDPTELFQRRKAHLTYWLLRVLLNSLSMLGTFPSY